jgi:hypothetical protein
MILYAATTFLERLTSRFQRGTANGGNRRYPSFGLAYSNGRSPPNQVIGREAALSRILTLLQSGHLIDRSP